ncbi:uncharacterized protein METZ01_LOCUS98255 [marine metagenome]|uniref:Uncharacterized protein n=1 Tax=marine metagenome TaxID=408172 RepID=A0A381VZ85_9ZZZZ
MAHIIHLILQYRGVLNRVDLISGHRNKTGKNKAPVVRVYFLLWPIMSDRVHS